jgi:hypothetical protein
MVSRTVLDWPKGISNVLALMRSASGFKYLILSADKHTPVSQTPGRDLGEIILL